MTSVSTVKPAPIRRDWFVKSLAGALLGLTLAFACSGLFALVASGLAPSARAQLMMWLVVPVWLSVFSGCYFFTSGLRAWLWLGGANLLAWGVLGAARLI
ncbi:hypothetical protein Q9Q94_08865 [Uliginosibacterium sp. 31-16]|uniref:hypothetical protein n=1 Tax=Uliginosibacterium sp. 31-16 TaxID=3068315 RepID=UPI00273E6ABE|nr:hypothetical protein [Uliginosibacterium sp. 31-16]MDP5239639.1 hypothetical protein [Uliginosibacterium sp. 31-16]